MALGTTRFIGGHGNTEVINKIDFTVNTRLITFDIGGDAIPCKVTGGNKFVTNLAMAIKTTCGSLIGVIGEEVEADQVISRLNAKHGFIQGVVMKRVVLRNTPRLTFVADNSVERGVRVLNILEELGEIDLENGNESPDN